MSSRYFVFIILFQELFYIDSMMIEPFFFMVIMTKKKKSKQLIKKNKPVSQNIDSCDRIAGKHTISTHKNICLNNNHYHNNHHYTYISLSSFLFFSLFVVVCVSRYTTYIVCRCFFLSLMIKKNKC